MFHRLSETLLRRAIACAAATPASNGQARPRLVSAPVVVAGLAVLGLFGARADAVSSLDAALAVKNLNANDTTFHFTFGSPYFGGPYNAAAANVGGALADATGDGASLTGSFKARVDAATLFDIPLSAVIAPGGGAGAMTSIPGGVDSPATDSAPVATGAGGNLTQKVSFNLSGRDTAVFLAAAVLSGGGAPEVMLSGFALINVNASPTDFELTFNQTFANRHDTLSVSLLGAFMDNAGDGAAINGLLLETFIDGVEISDAELSGSAATSGLLAIDSLPGGSLLASTLFTSFASPASGTMELDLMFDLTGNGDSAALTSGLHLFNAPAAGAVPEPSSMLLAALGATALARRCTRRRPA